MQTPHRDEYNHTPTARPPRRTNEPLQDPLEGLSLLSLLQIVKELLQAKACVNQLDREVSPLWAAISGRHSAVVVHLQELGAKLSPSDTEAMETCLMRSRYEGSMELQNAPMGCLPAHQLICELPPRKLTRTLTALRATIKRYQGC